MSRRPISFAGVCPRLRPIPITQPQTHGMGRQFFNQQYLLVFIETRGLIWLELILRRKPPLRMLAYVFRRDAAH